MIRKLIEAHLDSPKAYFTEIIYSLFVTDNIVTTVADYYIQTHDSETLSNIVDSKSYNNTNAIDYIINSLINKDGLPFYLFLFYYFYNKDNINVIDLAKITCYIKTNTKYSNEFKLFLSKFLYRFDEDIYNSYQNEALVGANDYEDFYDRYIKILNCKN